MAEDMSEDPEELHNTSTSNPDTSSISTSDTESSSNSDSNDSMKSTFSIASTISMQLWPHIPIG